MIEIQIKTISRNTWLQKIGYYETASFFNEFGVLVSFHNGYNRVYDD